MLWSSAVAAASGTVPIPGANFAIDIPVIISLFKFIRETYSLTDKALSTTEMAVPALAPLVNNVVKYASTEGVVLLLTEYSGAVIAEQVSKFVPIIGTAVAASLGFAVVRKIGNLYLRDCHRLAEATLESQFNVAKVELA